MLKKCASAEARAGVLKQIRKNKPTNKCINMKLSACQTPESFYENLGDALGIKSRGLSAG